MIRRSPSRNQRSKGIKVKHVLQIILLLGVCFWLIYQVKRSHDKKKEFDENNARVSVGTQTEHGIPKLGRKDLHPGKGEVNQNEKHEEEVEYENTEEEDENNHEVNEREGEEQGNGHETDGKADNKHGVKGGEEEQAEDEDKIEEMEDERGGGDDEIDENDQERSEVDADRDELMDEEKEKEESDEKDNENTEDEETEGAVGNHNTHEAREEHYKGDDASSAVTHDTNTTTTETETVSLENSDDNAGMSIMKSENKSNYTEESSTARNQSDSDIKVTEVELATGGTSDATSGKEIGDNSLSDLVDSSQLNSTATTLSDSHSEASSNPTVPNPGASNNMTQSGADTSSEQNKTGIFSESQHGQNDIMNATATVDIKNVQTKELQHDGNNVSEENPDSKATAVVKTENGDAAAGESANLEGGGLEKTTRFVATNDTENKDNTETSNTVKTQNNSYVKENTDASATDNEKLKGVTQTGETGELSDSSTGNGAANSTDHSATDSSDSHILKDVTESHTDPGTLPDIRNEGDNTHNSDKTATE